MFERSVSGQQNRALFYGVTYTCYVEGGSDTHDRSVDITFWDQVLSTFRPEISFAFLPRGGKPVLEALARQIANDNIANTIVAMDVDYDRIFDELLDDPRVLYTHGYSWENDVYDSELLPRLVMTLMHKASLSSPLRERLNELVETFSNTVHRIIKLDALCLKAGSSLLPRDAPGRVIKQDEGTGSPCIDRREIIKLSAIANASTRPRQAIARFDVPIGLRYLVGHCTSHFVSLAIRAVLKEQGFRRSISADHIRDVSIQIFGRLLTQYSTSSVSVHHREQCAAIP